MGSVLVRYRWRYFCPIRNKMITTKAAFEEDSIKAEHPDAVPVDGSREEIALIDDPWSCSTSGFLSKVRDVGNGIVSKAADNHQDLSGDGKDFHDISKAAR